MYSRVMKPADSMVAHPILPSMLKRDSVDVFPCGYQSSTHCAVVISKTFSKMIVAYVGHNSQSENTPRRDR